jgi:FkbM family methyltransferase
MRGNMVGKILNRILFRLWLFLNSRIDFSQKLDYSKMDIRMDARSLLELYRLNACIKEPETVLWIEENIKNGDVFYDIGANVGSYSLIASAVTKGKCKIYAFEPSFNTFAKLNENIFLNNYEESIIPFLVALDNKTELKNFLFSSLLSGDARHSITDTLYQKTDGGINKKQQNVLCYRLDEFIDVFGLMSPNHIKIDVDGSELNVLYGADKTFNNISLKTVLIEIDEHDDEISNKIFNFMKAHKFNDFLRYPKEKKDVTISNYIFKRNF